MFSYQVRVSDNGVSEAGARLVSRKWLIDEYDEHGVLVNHEEVNGPGVIGLHPHIRKGCADFQYESCTVLVGKTAKMSGHFMFEDSQTKENFPVTINPFTISMAPDRLIEYTVATKTTRVLP